MNEEIEGQYIVNEGRSLFLQCVISSVFGGDVASWYREDNNGKTSPGKLATVSILYKCCCCIVPDLFEFSQEAFNGTQSFKEGITVNDFKQLFSFKRQVLTTYRSLRSRRATIPSSRDIEGTYICQGRNNNGTRSRSVNINVNSKCFIVVYSD